MELRSVRALYAGRGVSAVTLGCATLEAEHAEDVCRAARQLGVRLADTADAYGSSEALLGAYARPGGRPVPTRRTGRSGGAARLSSPTERAGTAGRSPRRRNLDSRTTSIRRNATTRPPSAPARAPSPDRACRGGRSLGGCCTRRRTTSRRAAERKTYPFCYERTTPALHRCKKEEERCFVGPRSSSRRRYGRPLVAALDRLVESGAAGAWGASVESVVSGAAAVSAGAKFLQAPFNALDQSLAPLLAACAASRVGVLARSALARGWLTARGVHAARLALSRGGGGEHALLYARVARVGAVSEAHGLRVEHCALRFAAHAAGVSTVIVATVRGGNNPTSARWIVSRRRDDPRRGREEFSRRPPPTRGRWRT